MPSFDIPTTTPVLAESIDLAIAKFKLKYPGKEYSEVKMIYDGVVI